MALSNANSLPLGSSSNDAMARSARAEYDRRNRSLPHPKYGPYTCPRCKGLFRTSQIFAAHMRSHYRSESEEERRMRLEEKHRRHGSRRGPARLVARPMVMAFQPIQLSRQTLNTLEGNVPMPVKTENFEVHENRWGPARLAARPMVMAFQPIQLSRHTLNTLEGNVPMPVKTENFEVHEMEDVEDIGSALGLREVKQELM